MYENRHTTKPSKQPLTIV